MSSDSSTPTPNELACLLWVVRALDDRVLQTRLLDQAKTVEVIGRASMHTELSVSADARAAETGDGPLDVHAVAFDIEQRPIGFVTVWLADGLLTSISFGWVTDDMPRDFPPARTLRQDRQHREKGPSQSDDVDAALSDLAAARRIGPRREWRGVPEEQLRRLETNLGRELHRGYRRFLSQVGIDGARALADETALFWPDPLDFAELIEDMGPVPISDRCTPILIHQGYYVQWIDFESGAVFGWVESDELDNRVLVAPSFGDWLRLHLTA